VDVKYEELVKWLANGDAIAVNYGSYKYQKGKSSWRVLNTHDENKNPCGRRFYTRTGQRPIVIPERIGRDVPHHSLYIPSGGIL
jgi:hypothetical protein